MNTAWKSCLLICIGWFACGSALAQSGAAPQKPPAAGATSPAAAPAAAAPTSEPPPAGDQPAFKPEELEQMLAPIALYPDPLLSQILMASTYPIEVVEAERWLKANPTLKGDALAKELEKQSWDPSVRSLVNFPDVLAMMSENLSTTVKIGDAFIGQQKQVMDAVQKLRAKAKASGNLETNKEQNVTTVTQEGAQVIVVQPASPQVIYVPQYNPTVVYGSWPYPAYPPYPYYPPGYVAHTALAFGVGVACGAAWGYAWGNCNWGHGDVDIDINRNTNINNNIDRSKFKNSNVGGGGRGEWKHDPGHRQGAAYRNQASAQRVGAGTTSTRATQARSEYRGKADAGRADIARGGADAARGGATRAPGAAGAAGDARTGQGQGAPRTSNNAAQNRSSTTGGSKGGALNDANRGGASARQSSDRGAASRTASPSSRSSPPRSSGASRGGGGRGGGRRG